MKIIIIFAAIYFIVDYKDKIFQYSDFLLYFKNNNTII